jgi:hypothetical protein
MFVFFIISANSLIYESFAVPIVFIWLYLRFYGTIDVVFFVLLKDAFFILPKTKALKITKTKKTGNSKELPVQCYKRGE